jgi:tetratricopeptide (TPR) repeat protein
LFDYWIAALRGDLTSALTAARARARANPGSPGTTLLHGGAALSVNRPRETIDAYTSPDVRIETIGGYPPFWDQLALAHHLLGEHRRELGAARRGRRQNPDVLLMVQSEVRALAALGRTADVMQRLDEAASFPPSPFLTPGQLMERAATELLAHGKEEPARAASARALEWYTERLGTDSAVSLRRLALVRAMYTAGRYEQARNVVAALSSTFASHPDVLGYRGALAARLGDRATALAADTALSALQERYLDGANTMWRARIAALLGEGDRAVELLHKALGEGRFHPALHDDPHFLSLRENAAFQDLMRPKGR